MDDVPYINQLQLMRKGIRRNKEFLTLLWNESGFEDSHRWFDCMTPKTARREHEPVMTLEEFIILLDAKGDVKLQLASPRPERITYVAFTKPTAENEMMFAWLQMPYTPKNVARIAQCYETAFDKRLQDEPVPKGLIDHYHRSRRENRR